MKRVAKELGETMSGKSTCPILDPLVHSNIQFFIYMNNFVDAELLEMIERADTDGDGEISPEEFFSIMTKKTFT